MTLATIDELHVLADRLIQETENENNEKKKEICIDAVLDLLVMAYVFGARRTEDGIPENVLGILERESEDIANQIANGEAPVSAETIYEAVYKPIAGETFAERISSRIDEGTLDRDTLKRILETEYHRVEETGAYDTAGVISSLTGLSAYKRWETMQDDRVRETHWAIEGQTVPFNQPFRSVDGYEAMYPGQFGVPEEDINCRCFVSYIFQ